MGDLVFQLILTFVVLVNVVLVIVTTSSVPLILLMVAILAGSLIIDYLTYKRYLRNKDKYN